MIRFGPAGNSDSFYEQGKKSSQQMPGWLRQMGLSAYEYQCGKGVNIGEDAARKIGEEARLNDIYLSIHAPYYINMANPEKEKRNNSIKYILESLAVARWMGAKRVVVHTGSTSKVERGWALSAAMEVLKEAIVEADQMGLGDIHICPEVLGKLNQLGSLEEILEMCRMDGRLIPTVDFGHLHARSMGGMKTQQDFEKVVEEIENKLGYERLQKLHIHFSRIEYTKGGEKKHWTLDDTQFGPEFDYLAEVIYKKKMEPVIISESRGTMAEDALKMKNIYESKIK